MKNNPLDDIVKCNIDISSPASNDVTFNSILLVVAGPISGEGEKTDKVFAVSQAETLLDYGYTEDEPAFVAARIAFAQNPAPESLFMCVRRKTSVEGAADVTFEDIALTLNRAESESNFYGVHLTGFSNEEDIQKTAEWVAGKEKIFGFEYTDLENFPLENDDYYRTFAIFSGNADGYKENEQPKNNRYMALAWMANCFGYEPGSETWHLKELADVYPSYINDMNKLELEEKNINSFRMYAGKNVTFGGKMISGEWIDTIRFRDWLKNEMQFNVFRAIQSNRKIPFTDAGIGLIEGKMEETLKKGQDIGGIAPTVYDDDGNPVYGYSVKVPRAIDLSEKERHSRKLTGCRYSARLAGAIHAVEIHGNLTF